MNDVKEVFSALHPRSQLLSMVLIRMLRVVASQSESNDMSALALGNVMASPLFFADSDDAAAALLEEEQTIRRCVLVARKLDNSSIMSVLTVAVAFCHASFVYNRSSFRSRGITQRYLPHHPTQYFLVSLARHCEEKSSTWHYRLGRAIACIARIPLPPG